MPYESPNIVLVPTVSFETKNMKVAQRKPEQSDQVSSSNTASGSANVLVPTLFPANVQVPNSTVSPFTSNTPHENLKPSDLWPDIYYYDFQGANENASLTDNTTGRQTILKYPEVYCDSTQYIVTGGANWNKSLTYDESGELPILNPPPEIYVTQGVKKAASLTNNKYQVETTLKSILKPPQTSPSEDCDNANNCVSWTSNCVESTGCASKPINLNLTLPRNNNMKKIERTPGNGSDQIKISLSSHPNIKKVDEKKSNQPLLETPHYPLGPGFKPSWDTRTWLTHGSNKNAVCYPNENTNLCNVKVTSQHSSGSSFIPRVGLTELTRASDMDKTLNSSEDNRVSRLLFKDKTTKSNLNIQPKPDSSYPNITCHSATSDIFTPPMDIITRNQPYNIKKTTDSIHTKPLTNTNLTILTHNDDKIDSSINVADNTTSNLQHVDKTSGSLTTNITTSNKISAAFVQGKCSIKPINKQSRETDRTIKKNKIKLCHKKGTTPEMSKICKTKLNKTVYIKKNVSSNINTNKEEVERITARLIEQSKHVSEKIQELTFNKNTKTFKISSEKEKSKTYNKLEPDNVILNTEIKSNNSSKINHNENTNKKTCSVKTSQKRRHNSEDENIKRIKIKKNAHSNSLELQQKKEVSGKSVNVTTSRPKSKKIIPFHDTEQENKRYHNSKQRNSNRPVTNKTRSHISERRPKKHVSNNSNESIELPPKKRICHNAENELINDSTSVNKVGPSKSVVQLPDPFQLKHPRIQAPESCSENECESDFDLRSRLSQINLKHYPNKNKIYDTHSVDQIEPRKNVVISLNLKGDEENAKSSNSEPPKKLPTSIQILKSPNQNLGSPRKSPTPGPSKLSPIPAQPQHSSKPGPTKLKHKSKKYKKIQLIINVRCQVAEDSSEDSLSDDNNSTDAVNESYAMQNSDLSFLDDFNIDEIVNSLKYNPKKDNKPQDNRQKVLVKNNVSIKKPNNDFVRPIVIQSEIKTEYIKKEMQDEIVSNDNNSEPFKNQHENAEINSFSDIDNASLNCNQLSDNERSVNTLEIPTNIGNESIHLIKNIKQEKVDDEMENLNKGDQMVDIACEPSLNDDTHHTIIRLTDATVEKALNNIVNTKKSVINIVQPMTIKSETETEHSIQKEIQPEILSNDSDGEASENQQVNNEKNSDSEIGNQESSNFNQLDNERLKHTLEASTNIENNTVDLIQNIEEKVDKGENKKIHEQNIVEGVHQIMKQPSYSVLENCQSSHKPCLAAEVVNDIRSEQCENDENMNMDVDILSVADIEDLLEVLDSKVLPAPRETVPKHLESNKMCEVSASKITPTKIPLDSKIQEENNNQIKTCNNDEASINKVKDNKNVTDAEVPNDIRKQCENDKNMDVLSVADIEDLLEILDGKELPPSRETLPKHLESNKMCEVSGSKNTSSKIPLESKIQEENDNQIKTVNNDEEIINKEKDSKKSTETNVTLARTEEPVKTAETTTEKRSTPSKNYADTMIARIDNLSKEDRVLASKIETRISKYLHEDFSVVSLIKHGKYSKLFKYKDNNSGQYFAVKILTDESHRYLLGLQKEKMITDMQSDIPKVHLNTVYFINGFGIERKWCFLMDYYPRNLQQALNEEKLYIDEVQNLAKQLITAVLVLRNNNIVHSDIKPSHILLDETSQRLKVCGFDSSYYAGNAKVLPNIATVTYRAPEIILGLSAGFSIDVWATALVIYRMLTGKLLFQGTFNNDILYQQMSLLGNLPFDMLQDSPLAHNHFNGGAFMKRSGFRGMNVDLIKNFHGRKSIWGIIYNSYQERLPTKQFWWQRKQDISKLGSVHKLLEQMLVLDPRQRIPIEFVFAHPFIHNFT